ncbi:unnamed protein product [Sphagnum jensenii]|uniref:Uncharacterized protein n=1 Tax=Sphagnum jensenii TaxID=128206 RepID=A0ABP0WUD4_9BRYO
MTTQARKPTLSRSPSLARSPSIRRLPSSKHLNENAARPSSSHFSVYDLRTVNTDILTTFDAAEHGDSRAIMRFSKAKTFDVDAKDRYGRTALIWACDCAQLQCVQVLIRLSANINIADAHTGRGAIHWAARAANLAIVKLLVQYGCKFKAPDNYGLTPLYLAKTKGGVDGESVFKYLLGEGAPYNEIRAVDINKVEHEIAMRMAAIASGEADAALARGEADDADADA